MANETGIGQLDDIFDAETTQAMVLQELRPAMTSREFIRWATPGNSNVASFALYGDPGAATAPATDITDLSNTALSSTQAQATAAEVGLMVTVSDVLVKISVSNVMGDVAGMVARSVAEKFEGDLAALMDDFSNVTTAGSTLAPTDVLAGVSALEQRDIPGPYVGYLDPKQTGELRTEIATTTSSYAVGRDGDLVRPFGDSGFFGTYMGLPIWQTSLVVTTSGLVGGAIFASGQAIGGIELWGPRVEYQRDASLRGTEVVGTQCYGFVEIADTRGQTVKSLA